MHRAEDPLVNKLFWDSLFDNDGRILDEYMLRKKMFLGGIDPSLRAEAWKYFLNQYPFSSSLSERIDHIWSASKHYESLLDRADEAEMVGSAKFLKIVKIVDKDVARTDRDHPLFKKDDNPNLLALRNILLAYAIHDPELGYVQGMNDLAAPFLLIMQNELAAYSCFEAYMKRMRKNFIDIEMHDTLSTLKALVKYLDPKLHDHLCSCLDFSGQSDADWLFCHRWLLLDFKREFTLDEIPIFWERIWAQHSTNSFQIFIAVAILEANKNQIHAIQSPDELLGFLQHLTEGQNATKILQLAVAGVEQLRRDKALPANLKPLVVPTGGDATFAPPPRAPAIRTQPSTTGSNPIIGNAYRAGKRRGARYVAALS